jgi:hypothetical protein
VAIRESIASPINAVARFRPVAVYFVPKMRPRRSRSVQWGNVPTALNLAKGRARPSIRSLTPASGFSYS